MNGCISSGNHYYLVDTGHLRIERHLIDFKLHVIRVHFGDHIGCHREKVNSP